MSKNRNRNPGKKAHGLPLALLLLTLVCLGLDRTAGEPLSWLPLFNNRTKASARPDLLGGVTVPRGAGLTAIPHAVWANRGVTEMAVWLPSRLTAAAIFLPLQAPSGVGRLQQLVHQRDWKAALRVGEELMRTEPSNPNVHYLVGVARWQVDDKVGSIQAFHSAERMGLNTAYLHKALGLAYYGANQFRLFERQMERAIAADATDAQPFFHLGRYHESVRNDFERALSYFDEALARDPSHADSLYFRGYCLEVLQRTEEARDAYRKAAERGAASAYRGVARLLADTEPETALNWATKAVRSQPEQPESHYLLARISRKLDQPEEALRSLQRAIELDPDHAEAYFLLHQIYRHLGQKAKAERALTTFKQLRAAYGDF